MKILSRNPDYAYMLITDEIAIPLISEYLGKEGLAAFRKLNLGAAKGDFIRYLALYVYGGVYLDLDSSITIPLKSFIPENAEFVFFMDSDKNIQQWCFMISPRHAIMEVILAEMIKRISHGERNIFKATGPTLFTDVIYNRIRKTAIYDTRSNISDKDRETCFAENDSFEGGRILNEAEGAYRKYFLFRMKGYKESMMYDKQNAKYLPTFNSPTPNLYNS